MSISPGIPGIYLFLLQFNDITLRVGYFGNLPIHILPPNSALTFFIAICAINAANSTNIALPSNSTSNSSSDGTICTPTAGLNATDLSAGLFAGDSGVVPILKLALTLQRDILVPLILLAAILMLFAAILFALAKLTQKKLSDPATAAAAEKKLNIFKPATVATMWMAVCVAFAAAVATTMSVGALNSIIPVFATNMRVTGGKLLQSLQYLAFVFGALFALGATLMLASSGSEQQPGTTGDDYPPNEKNFEQGEFDEPMEGQDQQQYPEGEYPEGQYPEGQDPEGQYPEGQYPEGGYGEEQQQQYAEGQEDYDQQQGQPYPEDGEYDQEAYAQQQQQQQPYQ